MTHIGSRANMIRKGLEPGNSGSGGRSLIHSANGPLGEALADSGCGHTVCLNEERQSPWSDQKTVVRMGSDQDHSLTTGLSGRQLREPDQACGSDQTCGQTVVGFAVPGKEKKRWSDHDHNLTTDLLGRQRREPDQDRGQIVVLVWFSIRLTEKKGCLNARARCPGLGCLLPLTAPILPRP